LIRPGFRGGSIAWKAGWSYGKRQEPSSFAEAVPARSYESGAVRMVLETIQQTGERHGVIARIADQLGIDRETLRNRARQAEVDAGRHGIAASPNNKASSCVPRGDCTAGINSELQHL
jgi:hypothetical protein